MFLKDIFGYFLGSNGLTADLDALQRDFDTLYRKHIDMVRAVVRGFGFRDASQDDLVQQTFVKAWEHLPSLVNAKAFPGWIKCIARNSCLEALRQTKKTVTVSSSGEVSHTGSGRGSDIVLVAESPTEGDLLWEHSLELLKIAIAAQKSEPRATIARLFYFEEKSVREISDTLSLKQNTILSHLRRFRLTVGESLVSLMEEGTIPLMVTSNG